MLWLGSIKDRILERKLGIAFPLTSGIYLRLIDTV